MQFIVPFDQVGMGSPGPWTNANPGAGVQGSIVNADVFPAVQNEIVNTIIAAGYTPSSADLQQLLRAVRSGVLQYYADTGTADALAISPSPAHSALPAGMMFAVLKSAAANATTTPSLTVNGLTYTIVKEDGTAIVPGDLPAGVLFVVRSDGSKFRVQGLRKSDGVSSAPIHIADDAGVAGSMTATFSPAITIYQTDHLYIIGATSTCNGPTTANFNGVGTKSLKRNDGTPLQAGDWSTGMRLMFVYDGTNFRLTDLTLLEITQALATVYVPIPPNAASVTATYGMSGNQSVTSNVTTQVALTGSASSFCTIASGAVTLTKAGIYFLAGTLLGDTFQPSGQLQYSSLLIYKNGGLLTQTTISNYSFGEVLVALNISDAVYLAIGDVITLQFYTHSQANNDTGDSITASGTSLALVKVV